MVRATEGKITVNVRGKSRGIRLWFELSGVNCTVKLKACIRLSEVVCVSKFSAIPG